MSKVYSKTFEYKGQAIKYYNKVAYNLRVKRVNKWFSIKDGLWHVEWSYR